ncbi:MAG: hypothetical protein P1P72_01080 [ANME-2 cluster archaeon]|nr:hypothetical protein [ANME-2 cluster archaeon]
MFDDSTLNATLLIGPDPWGAYYDYSVFLGARLRLRNIGFGMTEHRSGYDELKTTFTYEDNDITARIRLVHGRDYDNDLQELWQDLNIQIKNRINCIGDLFCRSITLNKRHKGKKPHVLILAMCPLMQRWTEYASHDTCHRINQGA